MEQDEILYQKFITSKQEPVRLELALRGFFLRDGIAREQRKALRDYLQRRIRPAAEALIKEDDLPKLRALEELGWMDASVIEECLNTAIRLKKTEAFIWLLGVKTEKYGFQDKNFEL